MVPSKKDCDRHFSSYEHVDLRNLPSKMGLKNLFLPQRFKNRCRQTATVRSLKVTCNKAPHKAIQKKRLSARNYAAYAT